MSFCQESLSPEADPWRQRRLSDGWESVPSKRDGAAKDAQ